MPNHVTNKVIFRNDACAPLIMKMKMDRDPERDGWFDFNRILQQPQLEGDAWYNWRINHWGTKWNSYSFAELPDTEFLTIKFDTAWSTPDGIWQALAEQYPEAEIEIYYADEDTGHNLGYIVISEGGVAIDERSNATDAEKLEILNAVDDEGAWMICPKCQRFVGTDEQCCYCDDVEEPEDEEGEDMEQ